MNFRHLFIIIALALTASCTNHTEEAALVANNFLKSYFSNDYQAASTFCTEDISKEIMNSYQNFQSLSTDVQKGLKELSAQVGINIGQVSEISRDSVMVQYSLTIPDTPNGIENKLIIVRQDKMWRVAGL